MKTITEAEYKAQLHERIQNACHRLNAEAYEQQVLARGKALKQFKPCEKALELMLVISKEKHFGTAVEFAKITICSCHNGLTGQQLEAYLYDPSYKEANYNHDYLKLYPRLYGR